MNRTEATSEPLLAALGRTFPALIGTSLSGKVVTLPDDAGETASLVVLVFLEYAGRMVESRSSPFSGAFTANPRVKTYLVAVVGDSLIGSSLADRIRQGLAGGTPPEKHDQVLIYPEDIERCRRAYGIDDPSLAYIYLLDGRGIIRWMEKGTATPEGLADLLDIAGTLIEPLLT